MHRLTGAVTAVVGKARRLVRLDATPDRRRQAFSQEFGQAPPYQQASEAERERFRQEVVRPVLTQRAHAVQQAQQGGGQAADSGAVDPSTQEADAAFARAYQLAVDMGLAEKDQTYQDYLGPQT